MHVGNELGARKPRRVRMAALWCALAIGVDWGAEHMVGGAVHYEAWRVVRPMMAVVWLCKPEPDVVILFLFHGSKQWQARAIQRRV